MQPLFCISIDVEADHVDAPYWLRSDPLTFKSVTVGVRDRLTHVFDQARARPTYLITAEVIEDDEASYALANLGNEVELGTHLHPEYVEPDRIFDDPSGTRAGRYMHYYPADVQHAKLENISEIFRTRFGRNATSFRAGSFGIDNGSLAVLEGLGYRVDTSVIPGKRWTNRYGQVLDYRSMSSHPFFPVLNSPNASDPTDRLMEIPVTIEPDFRFAAKLAWPMFPLARGPFRRVYNRLTRSTWLRPTFSSFDQMRVVVDRVVGSSGSRFPPVLNMMFHTMEVIAGASPYASTDEDAKEILDRIRKIVTLASERDFKFCTLSEARQIHLTSLNNLQTVR